MKPSKGPWFNPWFSMPRTSVNTILFLILLSFSWCRGCKGLLENNEYEKQEAVVDCEENLKKVLKAQGPADFIYHSEPAEIFPELNGPNRSRNLLVADIGLYIDYAMEIVFGYCKTLGQCPNALDAFLKRNGNLLYNNNSNAYHAAGFIDSLNTETWDIAKRTIQDDTNRDYLEKLMQNLEERLAYHKEVLDQIETCDTYIIKLKNNETAKDTFVFSSYPSATINEHEATNSLSIEELKKRIKELENLLDFLNKMKKMKESDAKIDLNFNITLSEDFVCDYTVTYEVSGQTVALTAQWAASTTPLKNHTLTIDDSSTDENVKGFLGTLQRPFTLQVEVKGSNKGNIVKKINIVNDIITTYIKNETRIKYPWGKFSITFKVPKKINQSKQWRYREAYIQ